MRATHILPAINDMEVVYEACSEHNKPIVMHVSREPKSDAYKCAPYVLCKADKLEANIFQHQKYIHQVKPLQENLVWIFFCNCSRNHTFV